MPKNPPYMGMGTLCTAKKPPIYMCMRTLCIATRARTVHKHVLAAIHGAVQMHRHESGERVLYPNALQLQRQIPMP